MSAETESVRSISSLTFSQLRETNVVRCKESYHREIEEWSPADWLTAATGELGEVAHLLKDLRKGEIDGMAMRWRVGRELADVVIYLDLLAARLGIDLGEMVTTKFNETSEKIKSNHLLPD